MPDVDRNRRHLRQFGALILAVLLGAVACGSPSPSATVTPSASAAASQPLGTAGPSASPSPAVPASPSAVPSPSASPSPVAQLLPGAQAITVTGDVRVRSKPAVSADSQKYSPTLPSGTKLAVIGGPVVASNYTWIEVGLTSAKLDGGVDRGWVAVADHDGTPWVAIDASSVPAFEYVAGTAGQVAGTLAAAKQEASQANAFGLELYGKLLASGEVNPAKGMVFSPTSIVDALAMARAGAKGKTAAQMDKVLRATGWSQLSLGIASLDEQLASRDGTYTDDEGKVHVLSLHLANTVFAQNGFPIESAYLSSMGSTFGAGIQLVDFVAHTQDAIDAINGWVNAQTRGKIPVIVSPATITDGTRLALVNAIYLKANWVRNFDDGATVSKPFTLFDGKTVAVPMMHQWGEQAIGLATGSGWKATELYYRGPGGAPLSMTLVLPDNLRSFEKTLSPSLLGTIQSRIHAQENLLQKSKDDGMCGSYAYQVELRLPKFGIETGAELSKILRAMGMGDALDSSTADFTGINPDAGLYIGSVIHRATIDVDEKGTTAAAATVVGMDTGGSTGPEPAKTVALTFNHPFLFYIRDVSTGAILFMGRVTNPTQP